MTDVVFGFDVEDPINESADDALLALCHIFSDEGVPCSLFVAGEKARVLRQRGRHDVIAAMRDHEIAYHGNYWAEFPKPALEYGQDMPWDDAVAWKGNGYEAVSWRRLTRDGVPQGKDAPVAGEQDSPARHPAVASDGAGATLIAYERHPKTGDVPIRIGFRLLRSK